MDENNSTEVTEVIESGEQGSVVDSEKNRNDFDLIDTEEETKAEEKEEVNDGKADPVNQQTEEENRIAKKMRLKHEREVREAERKRVEEDDKFFRECGAVNPYTGKPFQNRKEFEEYGRKVKEADLKARAEESGKTVEEIAEEDEVREEIRKRKAGENSETRTATDRARDDLIEFMDKHENVDVDVLLKNEKFKKFCGSRLGRESLSTLYDDYEELVHDAEKSAKSDTRASRSTGSGGNGGDRLTASQRRALDEWNENNPTMKMTPSEYLKR